MAVPTTAGTSTTPEDDLPGSAGQSLVDQYREVRRRSQWICDPLSAEDCMLQSMPDASPIRWHLAHTTWFFETFLLKQLDGYKVYHPAYESLFNSYYNAIGRPFPRHQRGLLSRPSVDEVQQYRQHVDDHMQRWLTQTDLDADQQTVVQIGLQHEQQHQELMLTDIKHALSINPIYPVYRSDETRNNASLESKSGQTWLHHDDPGVFEVGCKGDGFHFDNEVPRHKTYIPPFAIARDLITCGQYRQFIDDGGYRQPGYWLSAGWSMVQSQRWDSPLYWTFNDDNWHHFTLHGLQVIDPDQPVSHLSYFEADAYARYRDCKLPTEQQWEYAVSRDAAERHAAAESNRATADITPSRRVVNGCDLRSVYGSLWQWTRSDYAAYPGYKPPGGAIGEYNGKFMCGCYVLRGGSCVTPPGHSRLTYRNFFDPSSRWQFTGIRLSKDLC